jgi:hypothetical protein
MLPDIIIQATQATHSIADRIEETANFVAVPVLNMPFKTI